MNDFRNAAQRAEMNDIVRFACAMNNNTLQKLHTAVTKLHRANTVLTMLLDSQDKEQAADLNSTALTFAYQAYAAQADICSYLYDQLANPRIKGIATPASYCRFKDKFESLMDQKADIRIETGDDMFVIRMPHPLTQYGHNKTKEPFLDSLKRALIRCFASGYPLSQGPCILSFWHIYGSNEIGFADNDNYLTKPIIDTICEALDMDDRGTALALFSSTMLTDEFCPATYVFISKQDDSGKNYCTKKGAKKCLQTLGFSDDFPP